MRVELVPARLQHVHLVASRMRPNDEAEVLASGGYRPAQALRRALVLSTFARTAFIGDQALAMFGVLEGGAITYPWLLTTTAVDRFPFTFWRACKIALAELRKVHPLMVQQIDARHEQALAWARRLGFRVEEPRAFGRAGLPFCRVTLGAS